MANLAFYAFAFASFANAEGKATTPPKTSTYHTAELFKELAPGGIENYNGNDVFAYSSSPHGFVVALDRLFFVESSIVHGEELWSMFIPSHMDDYSPNSAVAAMVKDINEESNLDATSGTYSPGAAIGSFGEHTMDVLDGRMYFFADNGKSGIELWFTDGTEDGTSMVRMSMHECVGGLLPLCILVNAFISLY